MKAVQILMDEDLIKAVDREAKRERSDRSKLVRAALVRYLAEQRRRDDEARHRQGYARKPVVRGEFWEPDTWPET